MNRIIIIKKFKNHHVLNGIGRTDFEVTIIKLLRFHNHSQLAATPLEASNYHNQYHKVIGSLYICLSVRPIIPKDLANH